MVAGQSTHLDGSARLDGSPRLDGSVKIEDRLPISKTAIRRHQRWSMGKTDEYQKPGYTHWSRWKKGVEKNMRSQARGLAMAQSRKQLTPRGSSALAITESHELNDDSLSEGTITHERVPLFDSDSAGGMNVGGVEYSTIGNNSTIEMSMSFMADHQMGTRFLSLPDARQQQQTHDKLADRLIQHQYTSTSVQSLRRLARDKVCFLTGRKTPYLLYLQEKDARNDRTRAYPTVGWASHFELHSLEGAQNHALRKAGRHRKKKALANFDATVTTRVMTPQFKPVTVRGALTQSYSVGEDSRFAHKHRKAWEQSGVGLQKDHEQQPKLKPKLSNDTSSSVTRYKFVHNHAASGKVLRLNQSSTSHCATCANEQ